MKRLLSVLSLNLMLCGVAIAAPQTMRLDYYHTGNSSREMFSVDRVIIEPLAWPGDLTRNIDDANLGITNLPAEGIAQDDQLHQREHHGHQHERGGAEELPHLAFDDSHLLGTLHAPITGTFDGSTNSARYTVWVDGKSR